MINKRALFFFVNLFCGKVFRLAGAGTILFLCACVDPVQPPLPDLYAVGISNLEAEYRSTSDDIRLTWTPPQDADIAFYEIRRYVDTTDTVSDALKSRFFSPGNSVTYIDTLDLVRGYYCYTVAPCRLEGNDTLRGRVSTPWVRVWGGKGIAFNINNSASTVTMPSCVLYFTDRYSKVDSVHFTQYLTANKPDFSYGDTANKTRSLHVSGTATRSLPWKLRLGDGKKIVYADIKFKDASRETLSAEVSIAPWEAKIRFENKRITLLSSLDSDDSVGYRTGPPDATMFYSEYVSGWQTYEDYTMLVPRIEFSVSIMGDPTFHTDFEYWLLMPEVDAIFPDNPSRTGLPPIYNVSQWLETVPYKGSLRFGGGPRHDEEYVYRYSLDTNSTAGKANLEYLVLDSAATDPIKTARLSGTPGENYRKLMRLLRSGMINAGKKQFILVVRFKGKYFGEDRIYYSSSHLFEGAAGFGGSVYILSKSRSTRSYFDFYRPMMMFASSTDKDFLNNGDTVTSVFNITMPSIQDRGNSRITDVDLIIAQCPDSVSWPFWTWTMDTLVQEMPLENLLSWPHVRMPFDIPLPKKVVGPVRWDDIDPREWRSGRYFIGIYVRDEYGNAGLAPTTFTNKQTNPFLITVVSGK